MICPLVQYCQNEPVIARPKVYDSERNRRAHVAYIEESEALTGNSIFKLTSPGTSVVTAKRGGKRKNIVRYAREEYGRIFVTIIYTPSERNVSFFSTTTPRRWKIKTMRVKPVKL